MLNILVWVLFGMLIGRLASRMLESRNSRHTLPYVVAGSMGALLGGSVFLIFDTAPLSAFQVEGLVFALVGAVAVIAVAQSLSRSAR